MFLKKSKQFLSKQLPFYKTICIYLRSFIIEKYKVVYPASYSSLHIHAHVLYLKCRPCFRALDTYKSRCHARLSLARQLFELIFFSFWHSRGCCMLRVAQRSRLKLLVLVIVLVVLCFFGSLLWVWAFLL